jgi:phenylacetic acid degradation operon negative regulatory protein
MKPKSLILDLLSTIDPAALPAQGFIAAGRIFGLKENTVRVALRRLAAGGTLEARGAGGDRRYALSPRSRVLNRHILAAQTLRPRAWRGDWIAVIAWAPGVARRERDELRQALRVLKLANLQPGVWVRPDNLDLSLPGVLREYGLEEEVLWTRGPLHHGRSDAALARDLFGLDRIARAVDRACRDLADSARRLPRLSAERALAETFTVGGRAIKTMFDDPLLPPALLPEGWRGAELRRRFALYDRIGRARWREALGTPLGGRPAPALGARAHTPLRLLSGGAAFRQSAFTG